MMNIFLNTDSYKVSMPNQYPQGITHVFSYIESRGGRYRDVVFFGLQSFIKEVLMKPFTQADIDEAVEVYALHGEPFDKERAEYILRKYNGYMPVRIKAAPEGTVIPVQNVMLTIENTDPECYWVTTYLETALLRAIWYGSTVATNSREIKKIIYQYMYETGGDMAGLGFKLHDFGCRGVSSVESAMLGGLAHLVNFMGTDTVPALVGGRRYYNETIAGFSIPAAEHSTITSWGQDNEVDAYRNMLKQFAKPGSIVAVVSDSYDIYNAVENIWGDQLRQEVIDSGATVVIRPDSGNPAEVVGKVAELLASKFGFTVNDKGYKLLKHVRIIQGDGINEHSIREILQTLKDKGFCADNVAFGMGGALLQAPQRDDQKFAMKCSSAKVNGEWVDVFKDPVTDHGKKSKKGRLSLIKENGIGGESFHTVPESVALGKQNVLQTVYEDGKLFVDDNFGDIRARAAVQHSDVFIEIKDRY